MVPLARVTRAQKLGAGAVVRVTAINMLRQEWAIACPADGGARRDMAVHMRTMRESAYRRTVAASLTRNRRGT